VRCAPSLRLRLRLRLRLPQYILRTGDFLGGPAPEYAELLAAQSPTFTCVVCERDTPRCSELLSGACDVCSLQLHDSSERQLDCIRKNNAHAKHETDKEPVVDACGALHLYMRQSPLNILDARMGVWRERREYLSEKCTWCDEGEGDGYNACIQCDNLHCWARLQRSCILKTWNHSWLQPCMDYLDLQIAWHQHVPRGICPSSPPCLSSPDL
jgi:hypothetical protein